MVLPGSHNSATYLTRNFLCVVKNYVSCQNRTVYSQLICGARVLDLRVAFYREGSLLEYWCAHTFLTVPLRAVVKDISRFVVENPSESVLVSLTPDY